MERSCPFSETDALIVFTGTRNRMVMFWISCICRPGSSCLETNDFVRGDYDYVLVNIV